MSKRLDLAGRQFGSWTVLEFAGTRASNGKALWRVRCSCPAQTERIVAGGDLRSGRSKSCGHGRPAVGVRNTKARKPSLTGQTIGGFLICEDTGRAEHRSALYKIKCVICGFQRERSRRSILASTQRKGNLVCPVCNAKKKDAKFQAAAATNSVQELTAEQIKLMNKAMRVAVFKIAPTHAPVHLEEVIQETWLELLQVPGLAQMGDNQLGATTYRFANNFAKRLFDVDAVRFVEPKKSEDGTWESDIFDRLIIPTTSQSQPSRELEALSLEMSGLTNEDRSFMAKCLECGFKDRLEKQKYEELARKVKAAYQNIRQEIDGNLNGEDGQVGE
jgi:Zn ribbon nucleic-acid-binding protein